jgi:hypothetical protein
MRRGPTYPMFRHCLADASGRCGIRNITFQQQLLEIGARLRRATRGSIARVVSSVVIIRAAQLLSVQSCGSSISEIAALISEVASVEYSKGSWSIFSSAPSGATEWPVVVLQQNSIKLARLRALRAGEVGEPALQWISPLDKSETGHARS